MRRAEEDAARYDSLAAERDAAQGRLAALREERTDRERERRMLERRLGVWERWEEWRLAGVRLERLEPVPATFPQDGPARLERALERRSDAERALEQARQRLEQARETLGSRVVDLALLDCGERLRELAGRTASCRNALAAIPGCAPIGSGRLPPCSANWPGSGRIGRLSASRGSGGLCRCVRHWNVRPSSGAAPFWIWKTRR